MAIGALVLLPFLGSRLGDIRTLSKKDWLGVVAISFIGMFGFTALLLYGMRLVPGVIGAIIMSTAPAITAMGSVLFLSDSWNQRKVVTILLAVLGVVLVNLRGTTPGQQTDVSSGTVALGSLLILGAVACEAGYTLIGKAATQRLDPMLTVFLASAMAVPLFLVPVIILEWRTFTPNAVETSGWLSLLVWGGVTLGLGSVLWYWGLRRAAGTVAAGFMGVMPVTALLLSYVLLSEPVRTTHLVGFAIVFAGVLLITREHGRNGP